MTEKSIESLLNDGKTEEVIQSLVHDLMIKDLNNVNSTLGLIENRNQQDVLMTELETGETILHVAAKYCGYPGDAEIIRRIAKLAPELMTRTRQGDFEGQTALHMLITKGNVKAVKTLMSVAKRRKKSSDNVLEYLLHESAKGRRFINTAMMGQISLHIAALTFNEDIVELLLEFGANILLKNDKQDTIFHTLIKYSAIYHDKIDKVLEMTKHLHEFLLRTDEDGRKSKNRIVRKYMMIWFEKNRDNFTPLQLAARYGVVDLYKYIINLPDVYCLFGDHDGLFDVKRYDITEIDSIANSRISFLKLNPKSKNTGKPTEGEISNTKVESESNSFFSWLSDCPETESVLEMLYSNDYQSKSAFQMIEMSPIKSLIRDKWDFYKKISTVWMLVHVLFMVVLTIYAVERPTIMYPVGGNISQAKLLHPGTQAFASSVQWISCAFGTLYFLLTILSIIAKFRRPNAKKYVGHNSEYILLLATFSLSTVSDSLMTESSPSHDSIPLILALITGWWYLTFFLRAYHLFGFFAEMIKRVIIGDFIRFFIFISIELIAFTAGIYILFQTDVSEENLSGSTRIQHDSYQSTLVIMFKLMIGLGELESITDSRVPALSVTLFVMFVIITYILLLNALIAMMSQTCALVVEDRYSHWRLQQLSIMLFVEDLFPQYCINKLLPCPGTHETVKGHDRFNNVISRERYLYEIHSLQEIFVSEEDNKIKTDNKKTTTIAETLGKWWETNVKRQKVSPGKCEMVTKIQNTKEMDRKYADIKVPGKVNRRSERKQQGTLEISRIDERGSVIEDDKEH